MWFRNVHRGTATLLCSVDPILRLLALLLSSCGMLSLFFFLWCCGPTGGTTFPCMMCLDHTHRRTTVDRTPLDEWSARRRDPCLTHDIHKRQIYMAPGGIFSFFFFFFVFFFFFFFFFNRRYNPWWVLACFTISFHNLLSLHFSLQFLTFIFFKSSSTCSSHLSLGLPTGLDEHGYHSVNFLTVLIVSILITWAAQRNLCDFMNLTIYIYIYINFVIILKYIL